jgi:type IV pilus assembly protein PilV
MKRRQGFTVIEVMIAIGVMTVGSMAIIGMQVQAQRQNQLARESQIATQFAQTWVERLKLDALLWTQVAVPNGAPSVTQALQNTVYLNDMFTAGAGTFNRLTGSPFSLHKSAATHQGYDIPGGNPFTYTDPFSNTSAHSFCVDARVGWVYFGRAMRVDVRVFWPRPGASIVDDYATCDDSSELLRPGSGSRAQLYHTVYMPTVLRVTELRQ